MGIIKLLKSTIIAIPAFADRSGYYSDHRMVSMGHDFAWRECMAGFPLPRNK